MPSPLQKAPLGLLGAFDLKTLGINPTAFGDTVVPISSTDDFYFLPNQRSTVAAAAVLSGVVATQTVPANEIWRIKGIGVACGRNVADVALTLELTVGLGRVAGFVVPVLKTVFGPVAATDLVQFNGLWLPRVILMRPGDRLVLSLQTTVSANATPSLTLDFEAFPQ
jgi:hypothetical protein